MSLEDTDNLAIFTPTDKGKRNSRRVRPSSRHRARTDGDVRRESRPCRRSPSGFTGARAGEIGDAVAALLRAKFIDMSRKTAEADFGAMFECRSTRCPRAFRLEIRTKRKGDAVLVQRLLIGVAHQAPPR